MANAPKTSVLPPRRRFSSRGARWFVRVLAGLGLLLVFVHAAVVGLLLHLDLPAGRRIVGALVTRTLNNTFQGTFQIGSIEHVHPYGIVGKDITVDDPYGKRVLVVSELRARANLPDIVYQVLFGKDELSIVITHARAERAEAFIQPDPTTGEPTIRGAFTPEPSPDEPGADEEPTRIVRVWLPVIEIGHAYGRGKPFPNGPALEADVDRVRGSVLAGPDGAAVDIERFGVVLRGVGGSDARGTAALHVRVPGGVSGRFDGHFGSLEVGAYAKIDKGKLDLRAEVPGATPEQVRALWPDWPLLVPVRGQAQASGTLPVLHTQGSFELDGAKLDIEGPLRLSGDVGVELDVTGRNVDLRAVFPDAPATAIDATARVAVWDKRGKIVVDANGTTLPTVIAGQAIPAADIVATYEDKRLVGKATLHEKGMPTKVDFKMEPSGAIELQARAPSFRIERSPRLRRLTSARGNVDARARARIVKGHISGELTADVADFSLDDVRLERGTLKATAEGALSAPERLQIDAHLTGKGGKARGMRFETVTAHARGPAERPRVEVKLEDPYGPNIEASATVATRDGARLEGLEVQVERQGARVSGKVSELDIEGRRISIDDLVLEGAGGTLRGTVKVRPDLLYLDLKGEDVDLEVIARALGLPKGSLQGKLRVDVDVNVARDVQRGRVVIGVGNATVSGISGLSMRLGATLDGDKLEGDLSGQVTGFGSVGAVWNTTLAGSPLREQSWRDMIGTSEIQVSGAELSHLQKLLPPELRVERVAGKGYAQLRLDRRTPAALPTVSVLAATHGLEVDRRPAEGQSEEQAWKVRGVDVQVGGTVSGETGEAHGTTRLVDRHGILVASSGAVQFDLRRALDTPSRIPEQLLSSPLEAVIVVPDRNLATLPPELGMPALAGTLRGQLSLSGNLLEPTFSADVVVRNLRDPASGVSLPVDAELDAKYEKSSGRFAAGAKVVQSGRQVALLGLSGTARWEDLIADGHPDVPRWTGSGHLTLDGLPLPVLAPLAEARVGGRLYGRVALERRTQLPQISASVEVREATVDYVPIGTGRFSVRSDGKTLNTSLRFAEGQGRLDANMLAALRWDGLVPAVDDARPISIDVKAREFDAVVLSPLLSEVLSELSGRVNAELHATLAKVASEENSDEREWSGKIRGRANMKEGIVRIRALGLELRDVELDATAQDEDGRTGIHVTGFKAKARSETYNVQGDADLYLERLRLVRASASISTMQSGVPIIIDGVNQADAKGRAVIQLVREPERMVVNVEVPKLEATIPRTLGRNVIALDENDDIQVLQPLSEPEAETSGGLPWRIVFDLGREVSIKRADMNIPISGRPIIELGQQTTFQGYILLAPGGRLQLFGKPFFIQSGKITFEGEPSNPRVDMVAAWRSPEGTTAYLEVHGTFREPRLVFRSDPPQPESQVMALLLGGKFGAASEVGNELIGGLFDDTVLGRVELRATTEDTTETEAYTAAVRLREKLFFEATYRRGFERIDPGADTPDVSGTFDWRFRRNWSLRTEIGTLGTGVDLLWQYRY